MALSGYLYAILRYKLNVEKALLYSSPGADTNIGGFEHTFNSFFTLIFFIIVSVLLLILIVIEHFIRKKNIIRYYFKIKVPYVIKAIHTIMLLIGLWFPFSRLLYAVFFLLLYPISEIILKTN